MLIWFDLFAEQLCHRSVHVCTFHRVGLVRIRLHEDDPPLNGLARPDVLREVRDSGQHAGTLRAGQEGAALPGSHRSLPLQGPQGSLLLPDARQVQHIAHVLASFHQLLSLQVMAVSTNLFISSKTIKRPYAPHGEVSKPYTVWLKSIASKTTQSNGIGYNYST